MCTINDDQINLDAQASGFQLLKFEALCHAKLIRHLVRLFSTNEPSPRYGCQPGRNTFIALGLQLDAAVFLYESIKHFSLIEPKNALQFQEASEYTDLEVIRNNVHTYFKKGGYFKKASTITTNNLAKYKLLEPDVFQPLRSDISLIFEITGKTRTLIGSDYFIQHCIFESNKKWTGQNHADFAKFLSASICAIANSFDATKYRLAPLEFSEHIANIELFDYKSANLYAATKLSPVTTFRLMLMLFQISYGLMLIEGIINSESVLRDDLWYCFFAKLLSIKYDESFDNLESILAFSKEDSIELSNYLYEGGLDITRLGARKFAQKLRNTIHYQEIVFNHELLSDSTTRGYITAMYLSNVGLSSISHFRDFFNIMLKEMKQLQATIRQIMSTDKTY